MIALCASPLPNAVKPPKLITVPVIFIGLVAEYSVLVSVPHSKPLLVALDFNTFPAEPVKPV